MERAITRTLVPALLIAASGAVAQTDVPRGGADICVGAGSAQALLTIKNKTGVAAKDVTISIYNTEGNAVPDITEVDILGTTKDHVDDNGDGDTTDADGDTDPNEDDTTDSSPGKTAKSILESGQMNNNSTQNVTVKLSGNLPAGSCFRVKFSTDIGGTHYDLCSTIPVDPFTGQGGTFISYGAAQAAPGLTTEPGFAIASLVVKVDPLNPLMSVELPEAYADSFVEVFGDGAFIQFVPPVPGGEVTDIGFGYMEPPFLETTVEVGAEVIPWAYEPPCIADFNQDGLTNILDFVAFQNAFKLNDPGADVNGDGILNILDFVAFQSEFQKGCEKQVVLVDDTFEDFEAGPVCGQGGWQAWPANPNHCADVTDEDARSITNSLKLVGDEEAPLGDDAVRVISGADDGLWNFQAWTFVPSDATGTGWVVMLNTYDPNGSKNWSLALALDASNGLIQENPLGKQNPPTLPLIVDQWVPIDVQVDLDNDSCNVYYDAQLLLAGQSWSAGMNAPGKTSIEALHLDAGDPGSGISAMFIDDVRLQSGN